MYKTLFKNEVNINNKFNCICYFSWKRWLPVFPYDICLHDRDMWGGLNRLNIREWTQSVHDQDVIQYTIVKFVLIKVTYLWRCTLHRPESSALTHWAPQARSTIHQEGTKILYLYPQVLYVPHGCWFYTLTLYTTT